MVSADIAEIVKVGGSMGLELSNKTCYSLFAPDRDNMTAFKLHINGSEIQNVECCKYLGILIDSDLKWNT